MNFLDLTLPTIEENLALDEALLNEVELGRQEPVLRVWELPHHAVVMGASGRLGEDVIVDQCRADSVPIARRSSGGGTVVVGPGALNFTVVLSREHAPGLDAVDTAQQYVLERLADSLRSRGVAVEVRGSGDLTTGPRKVAGSAQRRLRRHFLVHATVLHNFELDRISRYTRLPARQPAYREGRSHEDFVTNLDVPRSLLVDALRTAWEGSTGSARLGEGLLKSVRSLVEEKFGDPAWVSRL